MLRLVLLGAMLSTPIGGACCSSSTPSPLEELYGDRSSESPEPSCPNSHFGSLLIGDILATSLMHKLI
jgi:hypothetical protein